MEANAATAHALRDLDIATKILPIMSGLDLASICIIIKQSCGTLAGPFFSPLAAFLEMANPSLAMILRDSRDRKDDALPVALRSDLQVATLDTVGPGRLLHQAYSVAGRGVEKALGQAAHQLGLGPTATSCRIEKAFGDDNPTRQSRLDSLYDSFQPGRTIENERLLRTLKHDCQKLLEYALP